MYIGLVLYDKAGGMLVPRRDHVQDKTCQLFPMIPHLENMTIPLPDGRGITFVVRPAAVP